MYQSDQTTTEKILHCPGCGAWLNEESKFCRYCGAAQIASGADYITESLRLNGPTAFGESYPNNQSSSIQESKLPIGIAEHDPFRRYTTTRLAVPKLYHPVSGPLVKAVIDGVPATPSHSSLSSLSKRMLLALMAIPIWVMIILLSPLDAYASAKIIGNRI
jgi:hypothetical protein